MDGGWICHLGGSILLLYIGCNGTKRRARGEACARYIGRPTHGPANGRIALYPPQAGQPNFFAVVNKRRTG